MFDSLIAIGRGAGDAAPPTALAWALSSRRGDPAGVAYVEDVRRARPGDDAFAFHGAAMMLSLGDSSLADSVLPRLGRAGNPDALLLAGIVAAKRDQRVRARWLLQGLEVLQRILAEIRVAVSIRPFGGAAQDVLQGPELAVDRADVRGGGDALRDVMLDAEMRRALAAAPHPSTFRHPFPRDWLGEALTPLALDGPPTLADSVLTQAMETRPGWPSLYELKGVVAIRLGHCEEAAERFLTLLDFGLERSDGPELVTRCRRGIRP